MSDELLDVVNDDDLVTGQEMRSVVHARGLQHRGVHIFLFTPAGRLLVQRRSKDRSAYPSLLDGSVSEHVQAGEDYLTAALRGMREEMGLERVHLQPVITFRMNYGPNDNEVSRLFQGFVDPALVKFDTAEIEQIAYYSLTELLEQMENGEEAFCRWFIQIMRWATGKPSELNVLKIQDNVRLPWLPVK